MITYDSYMRLCWLYTLYFELFVRMHVFLPEPSQLKLKCYFIAMTPSVLSGVAICRMLVAISLHMES